MQLTCYKCGTRVDIVVVPAGPHLKAICSKCKSYIKFMSKEDKTELEAEEDAKWRKSND